jgi:hypothetical protein
MAFKGSVDPKRLSLLTKVLNDYCCQAGIAVGHPARERLGRRIVQLFQSGIHNPDELLGALIRLRKMARRSWLTVFFLRTRCVIGLARRTAGTMLTHAS